LAAGTASGVHGNLRNTLGTSSGTYWETGWKHKKFRKTSANVCPYRIPLSFKNSENESLIHNNGKKRGVKTRAQHSPETK
jgi:hypothetical protein